MACWFVSNINAICCVEIWRLNTTLVKEDLLVRFLICISISSQGLEKSNKEIYIRVFAFYFFAVWNTDITKQYRRLSKEYK